MDNSLSQFGSVRLRITCGDIHALLLKAGELGIVLYALNQEDSLTVSSIVNWNQYRKFTVCARKYGASVKLIEGLGPFWTIRSLFRRPILVCGILLIFLLTFYLPSRILLLEVKGNSRVPINKILDQASRCGITVGTSSQTIRSESMKNALLAALPELQWAGINTYGSRAVISVKERTEILEAHQSNSVTSMIATCDGVVRSCTATKGLLLCQPGQAVRKGDVLISGYTDCGLMIRATRAEGEIIADTERKMTVIVPLEYSYQGELIGQETNISVIIGKKRINLLKDSGILGTGCVKIYREYPLKLPGGFVLPISLVIEQYFTYSEQTQPVDPDACMTVASEYARQYLLENMISGRIWDSVVNAEVTNDLLIFRVIYSCTEMIGRVRNEGITDLYGKTD